MANEVVIGISLPQTGRYASSAYVYYSRAYDLWVRQINEAGGLLGKQVRLLVHDDGSEPERSAENYRRLIHDDQVDLLLGPCHSALVEPAAPIIEAAGKLLLQGSGSSHEIFRKGRRWLFLCWAGCDFDYPKSFLEYTSGPESPHPVRNVALVYTDGRIGNAVALGTRHYAGQLGIDVVFDQAIGAPPIDYAALMRRAYAAEPDAILVGLDHTRSDKPMHESVEAALGAGFRTSQIWLSDNPAPRDQQLGEAIDGVFMRGTWVWPDPSPLSRQFLGAFRDAHGANPEYHSAGGYACCQVLQQVVTATGTLDNAALREALLRMSFETVMGTVGFGEDGLPSGTIQLCQWQGDSLEIVYPAAARTKQARIG